MDTSNVNTAQETSEPQNALATYTYDEVKEASLSFFGGDELAADVFAGKYALQDLEGKIYEKTPIDLFRRLAKEFARIELKYPNPMSEEEIFGLFADWTVVAQGGPMSGIGNPFQIQSLSNCWVGETNVLTREGVKQISQVNVGDEVITHQGRYKKVAQVHKNFLGERQLFDVKCFRTPKCTVTGNHKVLALTAEDIEWGRDPSWHTIEYLRKGDFVAIPTMGTGAGTYTRDISETSVPLSRKDSSDRLWYEKTVSTSEVGLVTCWYSKTNKVTCRKRLQKVHRFWEIDEDFAFFLGLWYGDGCVFSADKISNRIRGITFTFGSHETDLIEFVTTYGEKLFGIKADVNDHNKEVDGSTQVVFHSALVGYVFRNTFGRGAQGKYLFKDAFGWDLPKVKKLLAGLISSDGTVTKEGDVRVVMINHKFIKEVYHLARRCGLPLGYSETTYSARLDFPKNSDLLSLVQKTYTDNRLALARNRVESSFGIAHRGGRSFVRIDGKTLSTRRDVYVYTLGVDEDHSYAIEGVLSQNCFVVDPPHDSYSGIFFTDQQEAQIMKRRGGVGFDISTIRPKGLATSNAARTTDGIGVFMERYSNTCREVGQDGRRGALMLTISVHHPEVLTFANIKRDKKKVTGANVSIRMSAEFRKAVKNGGKYLQRFPVEGPGPYLVEKWVDAREVWDNIVSAMRECSEPGFLFWDTIEEMSPADIYKDFGFKTISTNPCLTGDTLIAVADGRGFVPIKQLADEGMDVPVYCCDTKTGKIVVRLMRNPRKTGDALPVFKVTIEGGHTFRATGNHKMYLHDGSLKQVQDIMPGDQLQIARKTEKTLLEMGSSPRLRNPNPYIMLENSHGIKAEHRLIWEFFNGSVGKGFCIHHKNFDSKDNHLDNLECLTHEDHSEIHAVRMRGDNNPIFKIKADPTWLAEYSAKMSASTQGGKNGNALATVSHEDIRTHLTLLTKQLGVRVSHKVWQKYAKENGLPQVFTTWRKAALGDFLQLATEVAQSLGLDYPDLDPRLQETLHKVRTMGYLAEVVSGEVHITRNCEWCNNPFSAVWHSREVSFCSQTCSNYYTNSFSDCNTQRTASLRQMHESKSVKSKRALLDIYTEVRASLGREPLQKEVFEVCKQREVSFRLRTKYGFKNWEEVKQQADLHNHRVLRVEPCGSEDVYNGTVDDHHNFYFGGWDEGEQGKLLLLSKNCGEITLSKRDSCRLLFVNLCKFVLDPFTPQARFDYTRFEQVAAKAQRLMDDLVDLELEAVDAILAKIEKDPEPDHIKSVERDLWKGIRETGVKGRRTGLGISSLGDTFAYLGHKYGSPESIEITDKIYRSLALGSYRSSVQMAKERGPFPLFNLELEKGHPFLERIMNEDPELYQEYLKYGRRNIANTTTAPTGSTSILTQTTSGCEPVIFIKSRRKRKINPSDKNARVDETDKLGDKWQYYDVFHHGVMKWMEVTGETDITKSPYFGSTVEEIDYIKKIDIQAAAQKWICHSISNTTNLPKNVTVETVDSICRHAWETGCKGVTIYRIGSRDAVIVKDTDAQGQPLEIIETHAPKRPKELECDIHRVNVKGESYLVFVSLLQGKPYEVFAGLSELVEVPKKVKKGILIKNGKKDGVATYNLRINIGEDDDPLLFKDIVTMFSNPIYGAFTRTISLALRHGVPVQYLVEQLRKDKFSDITSFSSVIARVFSKSYIPDGTASTEKTCPSCGSTNIVYQQGCSTCMQCGNSKCG